MKNGGKMILLALATLGLTAGAKAIVTGFPYEGITNRNVFNLKLPGLDIVTNQPTPPVKLTLTGITTMTGVKLALLSAQPKSGQPEYYSLTEGQAQDQIEIVSIDEKARTVKVNNHGIPQTLDFLNDGAKLTGNPGPIGTPGMQVGTPGIPSPYNNNGNLPPNSSGNPLRTIPTRPLRAPTPGNPNVPGYAPNAYGGGAAYPGGAATPQGLTPDEQAILIEAQREKYNTEGRGDMANLLPPTQFSQPGNQSEQPANGMPALPIHRKFPGSP
jgi:hypothetical protein